MSFRSEKAYLCWMQVNVQSCDSNLKGCGIFTTEFREK